MARVFLFGSALVPQVRAALGLPQGQPTTIDGWRRVLRADYVGAALVPAQDSVAGELVEVADIAELSDIFQVLGAEAHTLTLPDGPALAFGMAEAGNSWSQSQWQARWADMIARSIIDIKHLLREHNVDNLANLRPQLLSHAAAWVRAQTEDRPLVHHSKVRASDIEQVDRQMPYVDYFMMEEQRLRFRRFNGTFSSEVKRAAFVSGDAAIVLPYDPKRDRVLLVEQFRFGPYVRGDKNPWSLEPIAGRVDAGETPEQAAHREAVEEAALSLRALHLVSKYYPSPGALSEYFYNFVGIADLPDDVARIGGLDAEDEDIRGVLLSTSELDALVASNEAQVGPLILIALWLSQNKSWLADL